MVAQVCDEDVKYLSISIIETRKLCSVWNTDREIYSVDNLEVLLWYLPDNYNGTKIAIILTPNLSNLLKTGSNGSIVVTWS